MRVLIILLLTVATMSCATQKRCFEKWPPKEEVIVEYRDTTIMVELPGDTIYREITIESPCPEDTIWIRPKAGVPVASLDTVHAQGSYSESKAWLERGKLKMTLIEHPQLIPVKIDSIIIERTQVEIHQEPPEKTIPWVYKASLPVAIALLLLWIIMIAFVVLRR